MRIAFVPQPFDVMYPPVVGGGSLALWIYYMARECAKRGHESIVFGNHRGLFPAKSTVSDQVKYFFMPTGPNRVANKASSIAARLWHRSGSIAARRPLFASSWHHRLYAEEVARKTRELKCDVIHVMNYSQFIPILRAANARCKLSLHMQCEWLSQLDPTLLAARLRQTDLIIGCSEYITRRTMETFPEFADRCVTIPNGAAEVEHDPGTHSENLDVLFVNRLSPEKGVHDMIRAFHVVLKRFPAARLWIVGGAGLTPFEYVVGLSQDPNVSALRTFYEREGNGTKDPYFEILENEAGQELGKRILFEGHIAHHQIGAYYRRAAVLVSASIWNEPFGISLIEAMMHGVPVVATRAGGMAEIVDHGKTGFLVEPGDPVALAGEICQVLEDRKRARQMGEMGRQKAIEKFSWSRVADRLLENFNCPRTSGRERQWTKINESEHLAG
jgi:glycosyltransferase involved in cell wall biosynthesis